MKRLVSLLVFSCAIAAAADLAAVRTVYVFPMARGLDQYLASRLTSHGVFQIVTDPKLADAVLSDRFGEVLQSQLESVFPTPKPEEEEDAEPTAKEDAKDAKPAKPAKVAGDTQYSPSSVISGLGDAKSSGGVTAPTSSFNRSKGNIFLVDAKSRQVLWSTYDPPKTNAARDLDRTASDIVSRIRKDLKPKK
jgi:hypothetical protein